VPRKCTVCALPDRAAVDLALARQVGYRTIAQQYGVSAWAVLRHRETHLAAQAVAAVQAEQQQDALDVMAELRRCFQRTNLLMNACDRWLRDPEDPSRYDVGPRAGDVLVIYEETGADGKPHQRKAPLDHLLARLGEAGMQPIGYESKHADPRELLLKAVAQLRPSIELLGELVGELDARGSINVTVMPEWLTIRSALLDTLADYPEARAAVAARLRTLEAA